ncbi:MAG: hypothetical protein JXQ66_07705 [Campylobacterales bacterium]|nr:hypothetical protein [Campylobacterales bacterium]
MNNRLDILISHIHEYKVIFARWADGDYEKNVADIRFTNDLIYLVQEDIKILKNID